jgi:hypothetical protein
MWRLGCSILVTTFVALALLGAPTLEVQRWWYGAVYWVGGAPEQATAYLNTMANLARYSVAVWEIPVPSRMDEPQAVEAPDAAHAQTRLDLSPPGMVIPGPQPGHWWGLPPLQLDDLAVPPLILIVFPTLEELQEELGNFEIVAGFSLPHAFRCSHQLAWLSPWLAGLLTQLEGPVLFLSLETESRAFFHHTLAHELRHWGFWLWCQLEGIEFEKLPLLWLEGLAEFSLLPRSAQRLSPLELYPAAAYWAREGGLLEVPRWLSYQVGASLVHLLVSKHRWQRFLVLLPEYLRGGEELLAAWEPEWRAWLSGELPRELEERLRALFQGMEQRLVQCAGMLKPIFPQAWELLFAGPERWPHFWELVGQPWPSPTPERWEELQVRERAFVLRLVDKESCTLPPEVSELLDRLAQLREEGRWEEYLAAYVEGVHTLIAGLPPSPAP